MPELPEVQTVVDTLRPHIVGRKITAASLLRADIVTPLTDLPPLLAGRSITAIDRRAKRIIFTLDNGNRFYIHLGMSGRLTLEPIDDPLLKHTHFTMDVGKRQVRFRDPRRFGGIWWLGEVPTEDDAIGPEPLSLRSNVLLARLTRTRRVIKSALLDQALIAGLGNIYVDESLFGAGIHPLTPANQLTPAQVGRLSRSIKTTLRRALRHKGSTLRDYVDGDGNAGGFQLLHRVYDRADLPCSKCRMQIQRIVVGGRSTHFCGSCQPDLR